MREFLIIWALAILAAVGYGLAHDQVTVRVCVEYFSVYHPPLVPTTDPTLLALGWGVIATWWMGAFLGLPLALAARAGRLPRVTARQLVKPLGVLLLFMAVSATIAGCYGFTHPMTTLPIALPAAKHAAFTADLFAHNTAYASGAWGAFVLYAWVIAMRRTMRRRGM